MRCDVCQSKEATVFLTQIVEGKMQKVNLCETCSKNKGVSDPVGFELAELLVGLGTAPSVDVQPPVPKCAICGFTQTEFKKTGRLGCSNCYDAFSRLLLGMLKNMHKGVRHNGKVPVQHHKLRSYQERLKALNDTLQQAVEAEEYEKAAAIRDEIHQLESECT